jgi:hypothetical protein
MLKLAGYVSIPRACSVAAVLFLFGCSSSKPYTLVAQLPPFSQQSQIIAATIDVANGSCFVRIMTGESGEVWKPVCFVKKNQPTYKSLLIASQEVDFGAVGSSFQVLSTTVPMVPGNSNPGERAVSSAPNSTTPATATGPSFPSQWNESPYPGHVVLQGQNSGYIVTKATLTIDGSQGTLDVAYKTGYAPLHLECSVTANQRGDFTLLFNPGELARISPGANYNITLSSESSSLSGNIWDSRGFDTWTPSLSAQWVAASYSSN